MLEFLYSCIETEFALSKILKHRLIFISSLDKGGVWRINTHSKHSFYNRQAQKHDLNSMNNLLKLTEFFLRCYGLIVPNIVFLLR